MKLRRLLSEDIDDDLKSANITWNLYIPHNKLEKGSRYIYWDMLLIPITYGSMEFLFPEWLRQCRRQNISMDDVKDFIRHAFLKADVGISTIPSLVNTSTKAFHDDDEFGHSEARVRIVVFDDPMMSGVVVSDGGVKDVFDLSNNVQTHLSNRLKNIIETLIKMLDMWLAKHEIN